MKNKKENNFAIKCLINKYLFAVEPEIRNRLPSFESFSKKTLKSMKNLLLQIMLLPRFDQRQLARFDKNIFALTKKYEKIARARYQDFIDYALLPIKSDEQKRKFKKLLVQLHGLDKLKNRQRPKRLKNIIDPANEEKIELRQAV